MDFHRRESAAAGLPDLRSILVVFAGLVAVIFLRLSRLDLNLRGSGVLLLRVDAGGILGSLRGGSDLRRGGAIAGGVVRHVRAIHAGDIRLVDVGDVGLVRPAVAVVAIVVAVAVVVGAVFVISTVVIGREDGGFATGEK